MLFREEAEIEKLALAKKLALTCRTSNEDDKAKQKEETLDRELEELLDDDFLKDFMEARMKEMMERTQNTTKIFGSVIQLESGESFLECSEREDDKVTVIVLVYDPRVEGCDAMAGCLESLAPQYPHIKWCKILCTAPGFSAHLSKQFKTTALPALLIYRAGVRSRPDQHQILLSVYLQVSCSATSSGSQTSWARISSPATWSPSLWNTA